MSLPVPNSSSSPLQMDPRALEEMDAPLIALASRSGGDLRKLLYAFFSFLHRRTDFYLVPHEDDYLNEGKNHPKMGFREGDAEKILLAAFRQFPLRKMPRQSDMMAQTERQVGAQAGKAAESKSTLLPTTTTLADSADDKKLSVNKKTATKPTTTHEETVRLTEEGLQVPVGNGGSTDKYKWTQTIDECSVLVSIPDGMRAKDLQVDMKSTFISVRSKKPPPEGQEDSGQVFVEGKLSESVVPSESTWSLEGGILVLVLYKKAKKFWETVLEGDAKIDTSLVDSTRRIGEYDEATQAQIRKMIFDQSQERRGLPTSDEISGKKPRPPAIPAALPPGVEYIDKETLDPECRT